MQPRSGPWPWHRSPSGFWRTRTYIAGGVTVLLVLEVVGWMAWRDNHGGAQAAGFASGLIRNASFDSGLRSWQPSRNAPSTVRDGRLCAQVPGGTTRTYDVTITQNDLSLVKGRSYTWGFTASSTPADQPVRAVVGLGVEPYDTYFEDSPKLPGAAKAYSYSFVAPADTPHGQVAFQVGGNPAPWRFCVDDVWLRAGTAAPTYRPDTGPPVRVNQVAYLPEGPKNATVVTTRAEPEPWQLKDAKGTTVLDGETSPRGMDPSSGQATQNIDFSSYDTEGRGFTLVAEGVASRPFDIGAEAYQRLTTDALKFYYTQRSGIAIDDKLRPGYGRAAGHLGTAPNQGDRTVPCQPKVCDYTLDVHGGWYDAGDQGKYVVNGGIATWQLLDAFERTRHPGVIAAWAADGALDIPESGNNVPDILDEARWELEFMMRMQVPKGRPEAGMVHHKVTDENWTELPLLPQADPQPRQLHPPSTAATLNLAATAAKAARLFKMYDQDFAARCLAAATSAWRAAVANPAVYATAADAVGGGPYDDDDVSDEFYWAAAELYLTTGGKTYEKQVLDSPHHSDDVFEPLGFSWGSTAALGRIALATVPNGLPDRDRARQSVMQGADTYLNVLYRQAYGIAYAPAGGRFDWGSNSGVLNNAVVLAAAYDITGNTDYRDAVLQSVDYILGRNALNMSFVTGYGTVSAHHQHSRWYAHQLDPALPNPPRGTLAGGPNSGLQDPVAKAKIPGCVGQFCYLDDIRSWSTNELAINWNAPLAWVAAFIAQD